MAQPRPCPLKPRLEQALGLNLRLNPLSDQQARHQLGKLLPNCRRMAKIHIWSEFEVLLIALFDTPFTTFKATQGAIFDRYLVIGGQWSADGGLYCTGLAMTIARWVLLVYGQHVTSVRRSSLNGPIHLAFSRRMASGSPLSLTINLSTTAYL